MRKPAEPEQAPLRIAFMGTPDFAVPSLQALIDAKLAPVLVISQPDRPVGRHQKLAPTPVKSLALQHQIPVWQPEKLKTADFLKAFEAERIDLIVTAAYGKILPQALLDLPRLGAINVHGSLLPKYRGASPVQAAILNQDQETGVTILRMTAKMDAGAILTMKSYSLKGTETVESLMPALAQLGASMLPDVVRALAEGRQEEKPQDESQATYVSLLTKEDGYLDLKQPAAALEARVRGTYPWPGAYLFYKGQKMKVQRAKALTVAEAETQLPEAQQASWVAGYQNAEIAERLPSPKTSLWLKTAEGILSLEEIQLPGGKRQQVRDVAHNYRPGERWTQEA